MSTLKEKVFNKKTALFVTILIVIVIICVVLKFSNKEQTNEFGSKSGLTNIYANTTTSAIRENEDGVDAFLNLAKEKNINFSSEDLKNCYNITPDFVKENSNYTIFKFKDTAETYIIYENEIYKIGNNKRERGTTSFALADINGDGNLELFYTYIWKITEVSRTNVSYFDPIKKKEFGIDQNYMEDNAVLIKNGDELSVYSGTISNEKDYTNLTVNARLEKHVLVNENGTIKAIERYQLEENFDK